MSEKRTAAKKQQGAKRSNGKRRLTKLAVYPSLLVLSLIVGLYVGYSIIGDGPGHEVFNISTWKHMYDLIFAEG